MFFSLLLLQTISCSFAAFFRSLSQSLAYCGHMFHSGLAVSSNILAGWQNKVENLRLGEFSLFYFLLSFPCLSIFLSLSLYFSLFCSALFSEGEEDWGSTEYEEVGTSLLNVVLRVLLSLSILFSSDEQKRKKRFLKTLDLCKGWSTHGTINLHPSASKLLAIRDQKAKQHFGKHMTVVIFSNNLHILFMLDDIEKKKEYLSFLMATNMIWFLFSRYKKYR